MRGKKYIVPILTLIVIGGAAGLFLTRTSTPPGKSVSIDALKNRPRPVLHGGALVRNTRSSHPYKTWTATNAAEIIRTCLEEKELAPLRRAFIPPRIREDPSLPPERQVLLVGRRILIPEKKSFPKKASGLQSPSPRGTTPFIVMFEDNRQENWADSIPGVTVRGYLPNRAWLTECTEEGLRLLSTAPGARAAEEWTQQDKLAPFLRFLQTAKTAVTGKMCVTVRTFVPDEAELIAQVAREADGEIIEITQGTRSGTVKTALPFSAVAALAKRGEVQWIEETPRYRTLNTLAAQPEHLNVTTAWNTLGLTGKGQVIGHADTGIDTGKKTTLHPDFTNTVLAMIAMGRPNDPSDFNGHGTHTAGSIVGNGSASGGKIRGMAWQAKLVHQSLVNKFDAFVNFNIYNLFETTYNYGAKIHSDSWGSGMRDTYGTYGVDCQDNDGFVFDYPDFLPIFSAGNSGTDNDTNGVIDADSIGIPASAKNMVTVGATESGRPRGTGGFSSYHWASFDGGIINDTEKYSFSVPPISTDFITEYADGVHQGIAGFSSRGPTDDGRVKPDVVAPGCDVLSCKSSLAYYETMSLYSGNTRYCYYLGTSMATPLVSGCAALIRQYLVENTAYSNPSAALVKAMLLGGSRTLTPGQYGTQQYREIPSSSPNSVEGWGQVNVGETLAPSNRTIRLYDRMAVTDDTTNTICLTVSEPGYPLDIVLNWIDYPASLGTAKALVNDLDLVVTGPDGTRYFPNGGTARDTINTVESVRLTSAPTGTYTIVVYGSSVPYKGGVAALYASGAFSSLVENFSLTTRIVDGSSGKTLDESFSWHAKDMIVGTVTATDFGFIGDTPYGFSGWFLDGQRQPDATSAAQNPVEGISMNTNHVAEARYLPFWQDENKNDLSDWWEQRYFGANQNSLPYYWDTDEDGWIELLESLDNTDPCNPADVPTPPQIIVTPLKTFQTDRSPWTVTAEITDNFSVEEAYLFWKEKSADSWTYVPLSFVSGNTYAAQITPEHYGRERVDYFFYAADLCGYFFQELAATSAVYQVIGEYETPWMEVTPAEFPLLQLTGETTNLSFSVRNRAGPDLVWTTRLAHASSLFTETNGWLHGGQNDVWHLSTNRTWNGAQVWYCGDDVTRLYPSNCYASLDTPAFSVGERGGFFYRQWIQTEYDSDQADNHFWDGGQVSLSTDGGVTFSSITPVNGYPGLVASNPASPFVQESPCMGNRNGRWETIRFDLSAHEGKTVIVRFTFGSDSYTEEEGWYIAEVTPYGFGETFPPWITSDVPLGGILADGWDYSSRLSIDSSLIEPNTEVSACLQMESNDPSLSLFYFLTVWRGHLLTTEAIGPGTVSTNHAFLFRDFPVTVTAQASPHAFLYAELINGFPKARPFTYQTTQDSVTFRSVTNDQTFAAYFTPRQWELTVISPWGSPIPEKGTHTVDEGSEIAASVATPVPTVPETKIRHACAGWTLEGGGYAETGTTSEVCFSLTNSATLTWRWIYEYYVCVTANGNGTVEPAEAWCPQGSDILFTAFPALYHHLAAWDGSNLRICKTNATSLLYPAVVFPAEFTATFAENRTATHNVPETWLAQYGFSGNFEEAAEGDTDNDGFATWKEWMADTDPTNALSLLCFLNMAFVSPQNPFLMWIGGNAVTQYVEHAETLEGPWTAFCTNLPPTSVTNVILAPYTTPAGFYRVTVPQRQ